MDGVGGGVLSDNLVDGVEGGVLLENIMDGVEVGYYQRTSWME